MNNVNLTMELCQEDRNRLDTLIAVGLELAKKNIYDMEGAVERQETAEDADEQVSMYDEEPAVVGKLGDKGNEKLFSAVQQKVVKLSAAGMEKKASVREIVQKYATKVSDIPAEEYDADMAALTALEG